MRRSAVVLVLLVTACGGGDDEQAGSPAVYDAIEAATSCASLQETFDRAAANNDRAQPGSNEHRWTLGYMRAVEERRGELGC